MTTTLTYNTRSGIDYYSPSHATSQEASTIFDRVRDWMESAEKAESLQARALGELNDVLLDCSDADWDGYSALPVEDGSFLRAKSLLSKLQVKFPAPAAGASPHGSITLEWMTGPRRRVMISIGVDEQIAYAAIFGDQTVQGVTSFFRDAPQEITELLSRLYFVR